VMSSTATTSASSGARSARCLTRVPSRQSTLSVRVGLDPRDFGLPGKPREPSPPASEDELVEFEREQRMNRAALMDSLYGTAWRS
jgi:hypothetical protein